MEDVTVIFRAAGKKFRAELLYDAADAQPWIVDCESLDERQRYSDPLEAISAYTGLIEGHLRTRAGDYYESVGLNRYTGDIYK
jgi:hypothetical protein